jgi:formylglycine-generating enzyme required for sulfatase activity
MIRVFVRDRAYWMDPFELSELRSGDYFSIRNQKPLVNVSKGEAAEICASLGKRLCSDIEWKLACVGIHGKKFGYGMNFAEGRCNVASKETSESGTFEECTTDTQLNDMIGNVMEWVDSGDDQRRVIAMGGSFMTGNSADCFTSLYFPENFKSDQIGFRCCK